MTVGVHRTTKAFLGAVAVLWRWRVVALPAAATMLLLSTCGLRYAAGTADNPIPPQGWRRRRTEFDIASPPELDGVRHRFIDLGGGVVIHVAEAGPADGSPVMLVHGFPQNWWEWRHVIGPLAADGYRVLCPDLRGAGWSSAPPDRYRKIDMAEDLAGLVDHLSVRSVTLVAHDWGGPVSFSMMVRHPEKVCGFFGVNTVAPYLAADMATLRHLWRFWYQVPIAIPVLGPRLLADRKARFARATMRWAGRGYMPAEDDMERYLGPMTESAHAVAGSRWYRTFLSREAIRWFRGEFPQARIDVPVRWLHGSADPVITPMLLRDYRDLIDDFDVEIVDGVGHWIVDQRPDVLLERLRRFLPGAVEASALP